MKIEKIIIVEESGKMHSHHKDDKRKCGKNGLFLMIDDQPEFHTVQGFCPMCFGLYLTDYFEANPDYQSAFARVCLAKAERLAGTLSAMLMGAADDSGKHNLS